jgi:hypothetical protein
VSTRIGLSWMLAGLSLIAACAEDPAILTQIVVVVDSDLTVPEQLDFVQIEVSGTKQPRLFDAAVEQAQLPQTLGLVYSGGPLGPVHVVARGWFDGEMIVERVADVSFKKGLTLKLALRLTRECARQPACESAEETCEHGECVPKSMSLPTFDGNDGPLFADAGPWSPEGGAFGGDSGLSSAADGGSDAGPDGAVAGPVCTINTPVDGARFYEGDTVSFDGSCIGPDGANVEPQWKSTLVKKLGNGGTFTNKKLAVGTHELSLCAVGTDACAPTRQIEIAAEPELGAMIGAFVQSGSSDYVFRADADLVVSGEGTGVPPLELTWIDSFAGEIGTGAQLTFNAPMIPGRHLLRLRVKDAHERVKTVERSFVVHAAGRTKLFETYDQENSVLMGEISALASDGIFHYVGTDSGHLYRVIADITDSTSPSVDATATTMPRPEVRGLYVHSSANRLYMATSADVQSCDVTNGTVKNCAALMLGNLGMAKPRCVRRLSVEGTDYLVVGTTAGLWVAPNSMLPMGTLRETGAEFNALAEGGGKLWIAGSDGLSSYSLASGALSGNPQKFPGATGTLKEIVASADHVWATLSSGFTRYDVNDDTWFTWTNSYVDSQFGRLVDDDVRSIAITHPVIDGVGHDVIWIGTAVGLSRFDPAVSSFTTYSIADGLPDNTVLRVVGLPSNELLLATPSGLAIHRGQ